MKVKELVQFLKTCDPDNDVLINIDGWGSAGVLHFEKGYWGPYHADDFATSADDLSEGEEPNCVVLMADQ